jgi:hypothetical protein
MNKKVLVLSAVTCVAGIVTATASGCSSSETTVTQNTPDATSDVKAADRTPVPPDDSGPTESCTKQVTVTEASIEADIGTYQPGKIQPNKCSAADITQFEANLKDTNLKEWLDLKTDLSPDCATCIITNTKDANWGPIVVNDEGAGFVNFGACFGALETDECGKQLQFGEFCYDQACADCTTDAEQQTCVEESSADNGSCKSFSDGVEANCKKLQTNFKKCENALAGAKTLCGPSAADAGADG